MAQATPDSADGLMRHAELIGQSLARHGSRRRADLQHDLRRRWRMASCEASDTLVRAARLQRRAHPPPSASDVQANLRLVARVAQMRRVEAFPAATHAEDQSTRKR